ncbi:hypothetical protein SAMN02745824_1991 [Parasphingorhabdus marina DSM 22363]|uniref:Uncharacterized protein n=1 Tax=Parasphingorhabdus marina DSM 22363 TaxID=1123272 RepID=A0A1N6ELW6_9SPHN|nr:hypothetical protein [Parasphingorhabdus marina]SIN83998.1 hypothetical protein SAMN02745824_1991 [Parasphingorhabdus marina DSM 22363]
MRDRPIDTLVDSLLANRPKGWAKAVLFRSACRSVPLALGKQSISVSDLDHWGKMIFRPLVLAWASRFSEKIWPETEITKNLVDASNPVSFEDQDHMFLPVALSAARTAYVFGDTVFPDPKDADDASYFEFTAQSASFVAKLTVDHAVKECTSEDTPQKYGADADKYLQAIFDDIDFLISNRSEKGNEIFNQPLWLQSAPAVFDDYWKRAKTDFQSENLGFWTSWFDRRINGMDRGFDQNPNSDMAIGEFLLEQVSTWWDQKFANVSAAIDQFKNELTDPNFTSNLSSESGIRPEKQNPYSAIFQTSNDQKITIAFGAGKDRLRKDTEANNRYNEAIRESNHLLDLCRGSNSAGDAPAIVELYLEALGQDLDDAKPSLIVLRGERIRKYLFALISENSDSLTPYVDDAIILQLSVLQDAHNLLVGLDPYLDRMDRARLGPDIDATSVSPRELRDRIKELHEQEVVSDETKEFIDQAVELALPPHKFSERLSGRVTGYAENFLRYSIEFVATYPLATVTSATIASMMTFGVVGTLLAGSTAITIIYHLGRNILANEEKYRKWAGNSPANQANYEKLLKLLKKLPLNSNPN